MPRRSARRAAAALLAVLVSVAAAGCASTEEPATAADADLARYESATELGQSLGLERRLSTVRGQVELGVGTERVLLFPRTTVASVGGRSYTLAEPAAEWDGEIWIRSDDAEAIRRLHAEVRSARTARNTPRPLPPPPAAPRAQPAPAAASVLAPTEAERREWSVPLRRRWEYIVVHHSASGRGSAAEIDKFHRDQNGWDGLGYDFVIGNGTGSRDGEVEVGYRWRQQLVGAHAKSPGHALGDNYMNEHGIGICLVGDFTKTRPTPAQMRSLAKLTGFLALYCGIPRDRLRLHRDVKPTECPGTHFPRDFAIPALPLAR